MSNPSDWKRLREEVLGKLDVLAEYLTWGLRPAAGEPNPSGWLPCHAIGRDDDDPSAGVNVGLNGRRGRYRDHGGGGDSLSFYDAAAKYGGHKDHFAALRHYAAKVGVKLPAGDEPDRPEDQLAFQPWDDLSALLYARATPGVLPAALQRIGARKAAWLRHRVRGSCQVVYALPVRGPRLLDGDPRGWVVMAADGKPLTIYRPGQPPTERKKHTLHGTKGGWIGDGAMRDLAGADIVWLVEGITDLLALESAIPDELRGRHVALTNSGGATETPDPLLLVLLRGKDVRVVRDADRAGEAGGAKWAPATAAFAGVCRHVRLPYLVEPDHGKDLRDWLLEGHAYAELETLAAGSPPIPPADPATAPSADGGGDAEIDKLCAAEPCTDLGNASRFVRRFGSRVRFCHPWKSWLVWDGRRWKSDDLGGARHLAQQAVQAIQREASVGPADAQYELHQWAAKSQASKRIGSVLAEAEVVPGIPVLPAALDQYPWLLNCPNGTLDLRTGALRPHDQADSLTKLCPTPYDAGAPCPRFEAFVSAIMAGDLELIGFLRRLAGTFLTGDVSEQLLAIFWGSGANGKSTLLRVLTETLGRDYSGKVAPNLLMSRNGEHHPTELAKLFGLRLAVATETEEGRRLAEVMVKELTGGDEISARRMREDFWDFRPTHKLCLCTNHKPRIRGGDHAIWRRLALIPFGVKFWSAERGEDGAAELRQTPGLADAIIAEEASGVLAWMVRGCLEWRQEGLRVPAKVRAATEEYRDAEDAITAFLKDRCICSASCRARLRDFYRGYRTWAEGGGERPLKERDFGRRLEERGFAKSKGGDGAMWWVGVDLRNANEDDAPQSNHDQNGRTWES